MSGGICEFLVLRRVRDGHISLVESRYYNRGVRLGAHLVEVLDQLVAGNRVESVQADGVQRLVLTSSGSSRLAALECMDPLSPRSQRG